MLKKCIKCGNYTISSEEKCQKCGGTLKEPHPPKFSLNDPFLEIKLRAIILSRKEKEAKP
ncbi:MAG: ribosome biogenesis protein [Candidatus Brockarchaeota archaeon]|nr:ribosome biogenesis protein [Candidatus Brockarchaeota archaeon]MBO3768191.1 ribosome biogenesis protein [Candidatus Brockarchaeota archaeon]MBO3800808.1 ribosome biogenesis protein [Candidatus Brockarchaeota archaeon]